MKLDPVELAQACSKRFDPQSVYTTLIDQAPSRPIAEGGAIIVCSDQDSNNVFVKIEPAVMRPKFAATRSKSREKKFPALNDRYILFGTFIKDRVKTEVPGFYADEHDQIVWPHGMLWQAADLVKTIISMPHIMCCPELLINSHLKLPMEGWEDFGLKVGPVDRSAESPSWRQAYDWFVGVSPWPMLPVSTRKETQFSSYYPGNWPLTVVDGGIAVADVRLSVRFVPTDASISVNLTSLCNIIKELAANSRDESKASLNNVLLEFGSQLTFEARPFFEVDGNQIEEAEWFNATKTKGGYYRLACGLTIDAPAYLTKTDQFILRKRVYAKFSRIGLRDIWSIHSEALSTSSTGMPPEEYIRQLSVTVSSALRDLDTQIAEPLIRELSKGTGDLASILRAYQAEGVAWAYLRFQLGFGVCIADEMGLGKTLQAIALIGAVRTRALPSMVIMPKTLLPNWQREIARFGKDLRVAVHGESSPNEPADVWLITYPRLRLNQENLAKRKWNLVVLDEAQAIKNSNTQVAGAANCLDARYRLVLTGTPVENRAGELWSIINWLNPGYLGREIDFSSYTNLARLSSQKPLLLAPLRESLDPIILRRTKSDPKVALGLPDKIFQETICELSNEQLRLYETVIETVLAQDTEELKLFARRALFLKAILYLKQICIHPDLFYGEGDGEDVLSEIDDAGSRKISSLVINRIKKTKGSSFDDWLNRSGKLSTVISLLESLNEQCRGVLIFTQYLGAADILRRAIGHVRAETVPFVHGGLTTDQRMELVDEFNESCVLHEAESEKFPILILSLKTGGSGLNLIGADRVIHFDRWWNPAVEDQATDRAHRIGQERSVFVHNITCQDTIEETTARIFVDKRRLAEDLLGAVTSEDVGELLRNQGGFLDLVDPQRIFSRRLVEGLRNEAKTEIFGRKPGSQVVGRRLPAHGPMANDFPI